jgi:hypothetical protein
MLLNKLLPPLLSHTLIQKMRLEFPPPLTK